MSIEQSNGVSVTRQNHIEPNEIIPAAIAAELAEVRKEIAELRDRVPEDKAALVVFSDNLDRAIAAFIIATGAAAAGLETTMFFTFWGLSVIKKKSSAAVSKRADFQGWSKTSKTASLKEQRTENSSDGKPIYIHVLERR